jgi:tryptophan-rich sensory protein
MIAVTTRAFYRVDKRAAYLMIPYLLWVCFATLLNGAIWLLNP